MNLRSTKIGSLAALLIAGLAFSAVQAQESLSPIVANDLLKAYESLENEQPGEALAQLNRLIERHGERMTPFDRASVMQIRGSAHVDLEDYSSALRDFAEVLRLNALPDDQQRLIRFNMAQLYFVTERYAESVEFFNEWLRDEPEPTANTYFMLAAANYQLERFRDAIEPIERAIEISEEPERKYYDLKNVLLSELGLDAERTELMKKMIVLWPDEVSYWRQLSSLYSAQNMQLESFSVLESAYHGGLINDEKDLILLAQYYSLFNNPHRGAELIEKEMQAERIERTVSNLELLSQLWSQAREHKKAIPVLREAARLSDTGLLSFRLGQSLLADEKSEEAEQALLAAIRKGELEDAMLGEAWMLLGNARFNRAGPGDRAQRRLADEAFAQAERFSTTRAQARNWRQYIRAIDETETRQAMLEREQSERLEMAAQERLLTACRAQQLAGSELGDECRAVLAAADADDNDEG